jgi:hypothetical protein
MEENEPNCYHEAKLEQNHEEYGLQRLKILTREFKPVLAWAKSKPSSDHAL